MPRQPGDPHIKPTRLFAEEKKELYRGEEHDDNDDYDKFGNEPIADAHKIVTDSPSANPAPQLTEEMEMLDPNYMHPEAARWFAMAPCLRRFPLFGSASRAFGPRFVLAVGMSFFLSKGAAGTIINYSRQPILVNDYKLSTTQYQRMSSMYTMGQSIQAFIAVITDLFPCFGYTKRWYMAFSGLFGGAFALTFALLPKRPSSAHPAAASIFLTCFSKANLEILSEGFYSRLMRRVPEVGPALVSWVSACTFAGTLVCACMMGPLSDADLTYVGVIISAVLQFFTVFIFAFNLYGEKPNREERHRDAVLDHMDRVAKQSAKQQRLLREREERQRWEEEVQRAQGGREVQLPLEDTTEALLPERMIEPFHEPHIISCGCLPFEINAEVVTAKWRIVAFAIVMTCSIIVLALITILGTDWMRLYACIVVIVVLSVGVFLALPVTVAKAGLFMLLNSVFYIQLFGALKNFYLAKPACYPEGPHFNYTFYNTIGSVVSNVAGAFASYLFNSVFSKRTYLYVFIVTTILEMAGSIFDLFLVKRWNLYIGIPDHAMYIFGYAVICEICTVLASLPQQMLMARLCPRGTETMSFAIMAGLSSAGTSLSSVIGSLLMDTVWPVRNKAPCNFDNVPYLILVGHICIPVLSIPLAFFLLPKARICDVLDKQGRPLPSRGGKKHWEEGPEITVPYGTGCGGGAAAAAAATTAAAGATVNDVYAAGKHGKQENEHFTGLVEPWQGYLDDDMEARERVYEDNISAAEANEHKEKRE